MCGFFFLLPNYFFPKMFCVKGQRALRSREPQSNCWGNLSLFSGSEARAFGYLHDVTLCKKHQAEQTMQNNANCCFPLISTECQCRGILVTCPQRLFPVFDILYDNVWSCKPGTLICERHLKSADEDKRVCEKEQYTPPKKVGRQTVSLLYWHLLGPNIDVGNPVNCTFFFG